MRRNLPSFIAALFAIFAAFSFVVAPRIAPVEALPFFIVIYGAIPRRGSIFEASLPIRGREIVAARVLWILALVWFPIVAWLFATAGSDLRALPAGMVLDTGAVLTLAVLLPCAIRPEQVDEPPVWLTALLWIALAAPSAAVTWFLPPAVSLELFAIAIVVVARWIWLRVPDSLEVAPRKAVASKKQDLATNASTSLTTRSAHAWKPFVFFLFQSGKNQSGNPSYLILLIYAAMFVLGLANGDRFQSIMLYYVLLALLPISMARQGTRWLTAFPISNRARLWCVLVPGVVIAMGCVGLGGLVSSTFFRNRTSMNANAPKGSHYRDDLTRVPLEFWGRATGEPVIRAPWGETAMADTLSVLREELQNPYTTNVGNTPRFVEWQFQRATTAVYGHPMTIALYQRRKADGALPPDVRNSPRMQILNLATIMAVVLLIALFSELTLWYRIGRSRAGTYVVSLPFAILFLGPIALDSVYREYPMSSVSVSIAESALMRLSGALPDNLAALAIISALPVIVLYAMLEWQFDRAESVDPKRSGTKLARLLARPAPFFRTS